MSLKEVIVPQLGESVSEASIAAWHKQPGDSVEVDDLLVELETDKVTLEINSPAKGVLSKIEIAEGETVEVGNLLGVIEEGASGGKVVNADDEKSSAPEATEAKGDVDIAPAAKKIIADNKLDASNITGTGKGGLITKGDVLAAIDSGANATPAKQTEASPAAKQVVSADREKRVRMSRLRQRIAQRLKDSQNTAAILSTFNEVDMKPVMDLRKKYQDKFVKAHDIKLGFMSLFVKAAVNSLKAIPTVNAEIEGDEIIYKNYYDIGVAVGTEQGLVVPVVRNADQLSLAGIEQEIARLAGKAKSGKLTMEELTGGTFTISNGGTYGSLLSTPIINPPQSGILGMHNIVQRPVAIDGKVEIRPMMYLALSYDHRIIDGGEAVTFLVKIKEFLEDPARLLLDI
ncbi:MAG: 2-oxoglutarate dehydrogenase complex dihydrolipoyllysine-residue succinyltransferase [Rickettsiales bacterium]|jgi:2-oxoglutarate dehydrogenase E2 component (dihydrolipoamide succinyltransferase)|nr:2-oxoglutarate dehydrogenase complex dihydrolipoyllysine-residue succinyltransferase [Rickettsiales bacterium]